jgi:hypothetical protein
LLRVLVDADNVPRRRLQPVLDMLEAEVDDVNLIASGRLRTLRRLRFSATAKLIAKVGWQNADAALARAYQPSEDPLILVTGDGDFALLALRHPGPVLVISGAASLQLHGAGQVVDPALEGLEPIRNWLRATGAVGD